MEIPSGCQRMRSLCAAGLCLPDDVGHHHACACTCPSPHAYQFLTMWTSLLQSKKALLACGLMKRSLNA